MYDMNFTDYSLMGMSLNMLFNLFKTSSYFLAFFCFSLLNLFIFGELYAELYVEYLFLIESYFTLSKIATVVNGLITPVALGTCNITVTCGTVTATCKVSVKSETVMLYNQGVVNNDTEFGNMVYPNNARFVFQSKQIFIEIPGSGSNYGSTWFSWANNVEISEYEYLDIHTTNPNDHSSVIGVTRNNAGQQSGYQMGTNTPVDSGTFISDRTVTTLLQGNKNHRLDMDLIGGDKGYLGMYFKRLESGDSVDEHILIDYIYVTRKSSYVVGSGEDLSQDATIPCTALNLTQDELVLSYKGQPINYDLNNLLIYSFFTQIYKNHSKNCASVC